MAITLYIPCSLLANAHHVCLQVYMGVDVFARGVDYPPGPGVAKPIGSARNDNNLSVAIFGPGWVLENEPGNLSQSAAEAAAAVVTFWDGLGLQQ